MSKVLYMYIEVRIVFCIHQLYGYQMVLLYPTYTLIIAVLTYRASWLQLLTEGVDGGGDRQLVILTGECIL
jgi:hypothetical protein